MYRAAALVVVICAVVVLVAVFAWSTRAPSVCVLTRHPVPAGTPPAPADAAWLSCEPPIRP
jgi:hypothetical protein